VHGFKDSIGNPRQAICTGHNVSLIKVVGQGRREPHNALYSMSHGSLKVELRGGDGVDSPH